MSRPSGASARPRLLLAAVLAASCATARDAEGPEAESLVIDRLEIAGARQLKDEEIKKRILTAESSWLPGWFPVLGDEQRFDPNAWQADLRRIERFYQANGYYQAKVVDEEVVSTRPGHVALRLRIEEGEPTRLTEVEVIGLEALASEHRSSVTHKLPLRVGEIFLEESWSAAKGALQSRLLELGYAEAAVSGEVAVDVSTRKAEARLEVRPGPRYRFGNIFVATDANAKVPGARVQEQAREAVVPGDWYSERALAEAQARVFAMGVFGGVKVNRGAPDREAGTVPVVVDVREAPFHTERLGGGVGVDQSRQEARLLGEYTHRNFLGGLRRYTLRGRAGYAFLPNVVEVARGSPQSKHAIFFQLTNELEQPRLFHPSVNLQTSLELTRGLEPAYEFIGGSYKLGLLWRPRTDLTVYPSYNLDVYWLSTAVPLDGRSPAVTYGCDEWCVLTYLEQTIELDRRDDRNEPRSGYYAAISFQEGTGPRVPSYLRIQPEARGYLSFGEEKRLTLAAKAKLGTLLVSDPSKTEPIITRFFSGGGSSMRGFNTRRLSPLLKVEERRIVDGQPRVEVTTLPVGGKGLLETSLEVRYNFAGDFVLATFLDGGFVTSGSFAVSDGRYWRDNLQLAAGIGLRYRTPLGPIRVDLARRLPVGPPLTVLPDDGTPYPVHGNCFGLGGASPGYAGSPEGLCTFHVSIGEAF